MDKVASDNGVPSKAHDPFLCFCGAGDCVCPCKRCDESRQREYRLKRLAQLADRFARAGIDLADMAELLLRQLDVHIEQQVEKLVDNVLRQRLKDVVIVSRVAKSSLDNFT